MLLHRRTIEPHAEVASAIRAAVNFALLILVTAVGSRTASGQPYDAAPQRLRVMTWNVEWMFDDYPADNRSALAIDQSAPSQAYWHAKRDGVAAVLAIHRPEIVALQEIESEHTLTEIAERLKTEHGLSYRWAFIPGSDRYTEQDVGLLFRQGLVNYRRHEQSKRMFDSQQFYSLSKHLVGEFRWENVGSPLTVMTIHLRAAADAEEIRLKQAGLARHWLAPQLQSGQDVILLGDFNTETQVLGPDVQVAAGSELTVTADGKETIRMVDLLAYLPDSSQSTHAFLKKQFDRILVSQSLMVDGPDKDWCFAKIEIFDDAIVRGQRDSYEHWSQRLSLGVDEFDLSDHHPVMATFELR